MMARSLNPRIRAAPVLALLVVWAAACAPGDREPVDEPETMGEPTSAELAAFRQEVGEALEALRYELQGMRERVAAAAPEEWEELSSTADRAQVEVMSAVDRLAEATAEEAREIRRAATERLAELEAEVTRSNLETMEDPEALRMVAEGQLDVLAADLTAIEERAMEKAGEVGAQDPEAPGPAPALTKVAELEANLHELRASTAEVAEAAGEEFAQAREALSEGVSELTLEVRRLWYAVRWDVDAAA
jgi:hypothetical protein